MNPPATAPVSAPAPDPATAPNDLLGAIPELEPDVPAEIFLQEGFWTPLSMSLAVAAIIIFALFCLWLRRKLKQQTPPPLISAEEKALVQLDLLEARKLDTRELSLELSLLLREFITQETQEPTLYETHQEFSSRLDSLASIPAQHQYELRCLLEELSELKYAQASMLSSDEFSASPLSLGSVGQSPFARARALILGISAAKRQQAEAELKQQALMEGRRKG